MFAVGFVLFILGCMGVAYYDNLGHQGRAGTASIGVFIGIFMCFLSLLIASWKYLP